METTLALDLLTIFFLSIETRGMDTLQLGQGTLKEVNLEIVATKSSFRPLMVTTPMPSNTITKVKTSNFHQQLHHFH